MGYIKKLKNNELVGGTDKHTIYPVTSTKAVFEEVTEGDKSSFKSQKTINGEHDGRIKDLEEEMPDTVKSITINGGTEHTVDESGNVDLTIYTVNPDDPDVPAMVELVEKNRDDIVDIKEEIGTDTTENTLSGRIKSLETTVGTGGTVDSRIATTKAELEEQIAGKQKTLSVGAGITLTSEGVISATADPSVAKVVEALPTGDAIVDGLIYLVKTDIAGTYSQHVHSTSGWSDDLPNVSLGITTDDAIDSTSTNPIQNKAITAQIGYFVCSASGSDPVKNVDAPSYSPSDVGGAFKIKMNYTNTCSDTVYLQFNSDSSTKKELRYNRQPVTPTNTWDSTGDNKEVISVYYDGTCYQASNAQGGGGKAEKIKYDNSESGLASDNVQGALDETASGVSELMSVFSGVKIVERFTLTGNNVTPASKRFYNLTAGKTYRITVDLDTFDYSSSTLNGYNIFSAAYVVGSQETLYFKTMKGTDTVVAVHEFVAADADYNYVLIRANAGCVVQFKLEELVANTEYIDEEPTEDSDKLVRSGGVYDSIGNIVNALVPTKQFSITGNGDTAVGYRFYPQAGSHCVLIADLSTFIHTNVTSGWNIYSVFYMPRTSSTSVMVFRTMKGTDTLVAKHEFDAVDAEYYEITIRANVGQEVDFSLTTVSEDGYIPIDSVPTENSYNLVRSGGVYSMLGKTDIISLNDENRTVRYLRNLKRPNYSQNGQYTPGLIPFTLLHFSDLHSDTVNLRRLLEYKEHYASFIDDAILTGDNIRNRFSDSFAFWGNPGAEDILLSTGNHEYWNGSNYTTITPLQVYNKFFAPYYENWGDTVVFPANADTEGYNYYYKDYPTRNIRLFVLDSMANMNGNRNGVQAAWLATELENARVAGRHVICAIHIGSTLETPFNNSFTSYAVVFDAEESNVNAPTFAEFYTLRDAVETFIDNGGKFVTWIGGHRHKDSIAVLYKKVNNENVPLQQTSIHVATCSGGEFSGDADEPGGTPKHGDTDNRNDGHSWWLVAKGDDSDRTDNTKQQDCFNIYSVDTEKKLLRIFRVGSDVDRNGRHKGSLLYDYANRQVLYCD